MSIIITDDFSYLDGDLSAVGSAKWKTPSAFGNLNVVSNKVGPNTSSLDGASCVKLTAWPGDLSSQWAMGTISTHADFMGLTFMNDGVSALYLIDSRSGGTQLYRVTIGPVFTSLASFATVWASGNIQYGKAIYDGIGQTDITVYKGGPPGIGTLVGTYSDTSVGRLIGGTPGMRMWYAGSSARFDDFSAGDFNAELPPDFGKYWNGLSGLSGMTSGGSIGGF